MAQMCSGADSSNSQLQTVFYGAADGVVYKGLGPVVRSWRVDSIQLLCNALFKDISFTACCWYLKSIDHLITVLTDQTARPGVIPTELGIQAKMAWLSDDHLNLLCKKENISKSSDSVAIIASLYKSAQQQILLEHPEPCVCQVD